MIEVIEVVEVIEVIEVIEVGKDKLVLSVYSYRFVIL